METQQGNSAEQLEGKSTQELLDALCEVQKIEPILLDRGRAFLRDVLSKEENFPTDRLNDCRVRVEVNDGGGLVVRVPVNRFEVDGSTLDAHPLKLEMKDQWSNLPGVARVETDGSMNSGIMNLDVYLQSDQLPEQDSSQAVEEVQEVVGKGLSQSV
ncbi:hypothetical protein ACFL3C_01415 [Patescibacteria group bacterium]